MKTSEEGLKIGDKVICIESTSWYDKGDVGVVTLRHPQEPDFFFSRYCVQFEGYVGRFWVVNNTVARRKNWLWRVIFEGVE